MHYFVIENTLFCCVNRELNSTFARLCHHVDLAKADLETDMDGLQQVIGRLDDAVTTSKSLK